MKVLLINKYYYPKGGAEVYLRNLERMLRAHGHETVVFAMKDVKNWAAKTGRYFALSVDFHGGWTGRLAWAGRQLFSRGAMGPLRELIEEEKPDLVHAHNIYHQLGPEILRVCKEYKLPVVMTLHDFKLICPNYQLYVKGEVCERCKRHKYCQALKYNCVKNSFLGSALAVTEMYWHNVIKKTYWRNVDKFLVPSRFMLEKMVDWGWERGKFEYIPNFTIRETRCRRGESGTKIDVARGKYILYFGRLTDEKGVDLLIKAWKKFCARRAGVRIGRDDENWRLIIAGRGSEENEYEEMIRKLRMKSKIEMIGFKSGEDLKNLIAEAALNILPSRIYENCPLSVLEAAELGVATLGARIGGIPEMIRAGVTGEMFEAGDAEDLFKKLNLLLARPERLVKMGEAARDLTREYFGEEWHWKKLKDVYGGVLKEAGSSESRWKNDKANV